MIASVKVKITTTSNVGEGPANETKETAMG